MVGAWACRGPLRVMLFHYRQVLLSAIFPLSVSQQEAVTVLKVHSSPSMSVLSSLPISVLPPLNVFPETFTVQND